ncbi:hypothetical protein I4F81_008478 [Pyropia yezoensis]|uniref:Uncharacterized protein n=1 Tax=Pyropia yezoensis TaxID=2788 RepID=A0ACC3C707_PYRYE|nr:hypothetical protein I4F81_008478 [Neopyropia yezoensis]
MADVLAAEAEDTPDALHVVVAGAGLPVAPSSVPTFEEIYAAAAPGGALEAAVSAAVAALSFAEEGGGEGGAADPAAPPAVDAFGATPPVVVDVAGTPTALEVVVAGAAGAPEARALRVRLGVRHPNVVSLYGGLTFLHANDLVHLDLHPGNILLGGPSGPARLARPRMYPSDTPTALFYASESTTPAELRAKTYTVSPEVARKEPASAAADVWALGSVAYALLSRGDPYPAGPSAAAGAEALAVLLLAGTPPPRARLADLAPPEVVSILYTHCFAATASRRSPAWMVLHHLFALRERSPGLFGRAPVHKGALDGGSPATDPELRALFPLRFRGRPPSGADPLPDWRRRAAAGEADACWNLHACYRRGQYVVRDVGLAIGWLFKYKRALDAEELAAAAAAATAAAGGGGGGAGDTYANGHAAGAAAAYDAYDASGGISVRQAVSGAPGGGDAADGGGVDASDLGGLAAAVMAGIPSDVGATAPRRGGRGVPLGGRTQSTPDRAAAASAAAAGASAVAAAAEAAAAAGGGGSGAAPYAGVAKTESGQAAERELVDWLEARVAADLDAEDSDGEWAYALALALDLHVGGREQSRARAAELYAMAAARSHGDATNVLGERHAAAGAARRAAAAYLTAESLGCVAASVNRARALCDPGVVGRRPGGGGGGGATAAGAAGAAAAAAAPPPAPLPGVPAAPTMTVQEADAATALAFYEAAAYAGSTDALHLSAQCHAAGLGLPAPAPYHAFERWRLAAERGHGDSLYAVAHCFATGSGVGRSAATAADYLRRAAAKGVPAALNELGEHVRGGDDPAGAGAGARAAAAAAGGAAPGAASAEAAAATAAAATPPADGDGGDRRKARALFEAAAAAGHPAAKRNLAAELLPTDPAGAAALLHAAASAGDGAAAAELAAIYERGAVPRGGAVAAAGRAGGGRRGGAAGGAAAAAGGGGGGGGGGVGRAVAKDTLAAHYWHKKAAAAGSRASARKLTSRGFRFAVAAARARALFRGGGGGTSSNKSSPA